MCAQSRLSDFDYSSSQTISWSRTSDLADCPSSSTVSQRESAGWFCCGLDTAEWKPTHSLARSAESCIFRTRIWPIWTPIVTQKKPW